MPEEKTYREILADLEEEVGINAGSTELAKKEEPPEGDKEPYTYSRTEAPGVAESGSY